MVCRQDVGTRPRYLYVSRRFHTRLSSVETLRPDFASRCAGQPQKTASFGTTARLPVDGPNRVGCYRGLITRPAAVDGQRQLSGTCPPSKTPFVKAVEYEGEPPPTPIPLIAMESWFYCLWRGLSQVQSYRRRVVRLLAPQDSQTASVRFPAD